MKRNICIVLTYRGNYGKMKSTMRAIQANNSLELQLVVGGGMLLEKYGSPIRYLEHDGFKPSKTFQFLLEGETPLTMAKSTGIAIVELASIFQNLKPDIVFAIADRFEAIAVATAASYMNIPVAHLEGGEVSGSIDDAVRHAITKLSHYHFVATSKSAENVIQMGEDKNRVFVVGSPTLDLIRDISLDLDFDPFERYAGVGPIFDIQPGRYLMVAQHPVTTEYGQARYQVEQTLKAVEELGLPALWLWPNMDAGADGISKGIRVFRELHNPSKIHFFKNFTFEDYAKLLANCAALVGNSSSGIRESAYLGVPVVNIGTRQNYRERGHNVIDVGYNKEEIKEAIKKQIQHGPYDPDYLYGDGKAGERIVQVLTTCPLSIQKKKFF
ncbi:UDP-N-acetylglucosamine 2-epimerase [Desulfovulcanus sp.]